MTNEHFEVGKFYNVNCAIIKNRTAITLVPVLFKPHVDKDFFVLEHYHLDTRFFDKKLDKIYNVKDGRTNKVIVTDGNEMTGTFIGTKIVKKRCSRNTYGLKVPSGLSDYELEKSAFFKWVDKMIGKKCNGRKCPHLGAEMVEHRGRLVCPVHNLITDCTKTKIQGVASYTDDLKTEIIGRHEGNNVLKTVDVI